MLQIFINILIYFYFDFIKNKKDIQYGAAEFDKIKIFQKIIKNFLKKLLQKAFLCYFNSREVFHQEKPL